MGKNKWMFAMLIMVVGVLFLTACSTAAGETAASPEETEVALKPDVAELNEQQEEGPAVLPPEEEEHLVGVLDNASETLISQGVITEILNDNQLHVVGEVEDNPVNDVLANISENTIYIDGQTGEAVEFTSLKEGDEVILYVSAATTRSIPPQANALAVVTNLTETGLGLPTYMEVAKLTPNEDGSISLLNQNEDVVVTIPAGQEIEPLYSDVTVTAKDIRVGTKLFAWYDMAALSMPAQATSTKTVVAVI